MLKIHVYCVYIYIYLYIYIIYIHYCDGTTEQPDRHEEQYVQYVLY